ncbi:MAG: uracil-DNA glycosylase [Candidatus Dojkabacteria bacterium]
MSNPKLDARSITRPKTKSNTKQNIKLPGSWKKVLAEEFEKDYFEQLMEFVRGEYNQGQVFPPPKQIFAAFDACEFDEVKVVILGQDPYHGVGQANGLAFSVSPGVKVPPSLRNIFKEIRADFGKPSVVEEQGMAAAADSEKTAGKVIEKPAGKVRGEGGLGKVGASAAGNRSGGNIKPFGDLSAWAEQGVLLLNATLTVRASSPGSHQNKGWEEFTDAVVKALNEQREGLVFILWGAYARKKGAIVDRSKHMTLESPHPSPFSADRGFFGSKPFSKANKYLEEQGRGPVVW